MKKYKLHQNVSPANLPQIGAYIPSTEQRLDIARICSTVEFHNWKFPGRPGPIQGVCPLSEVIDTSCVAIRAKADFGKTAWIDIFPIISKTSDRDSQLLEFVNFIVQSTNGMLAHRIANSYGYPILQTYRISQESGDKTVSVKNGRYSLTACSKIKTVVLEIPKSVGKFLHFYGDYLNSKEAK